MKKLIYFICIAISFMSCSVDDPISTAERNVVSEDGIVPFEQLLIFINLKTTDSSYLVVKSIDSVNIYVNDSYWSKINSQSLDTTKIKKYSIGNKFQTNNKLNYLIIADQDVEEPDYDTAGEYAEYLTGANELKPGEYACFIESFKVTFNDNTIKKYYPYEYKIFKVERDSRSASVGEIQINIE